MSDANDPGRRRFLQYAGLAAGAAATLGLSTVTRAAENAQAGHATGHASDKPLNRGWMFFTDSLEFATLADAAERIFPKDETGPGAKELAVPYFIDNQLAGAYGCNAREYVDGPFFPGAPTQGAQTPMLRHEQFRQGLQGLNAAARERFDKDFPQLDGTQQDGILSDCEAGKLPGFATAQFFSVLRGAVLAGVYADPLYNGNDDMDGWRLKDYPGAQMAYAYLMTSDTFEKIDPVSLSSMQ